MTRLLLTSLILSFASLATQAQTATVEPGTSLPCDLQAEGTDLVVFKCPVEASGAAQRLYFRADLLGSHDDTTASLSTQLSGAPLVCEDGSKTETTGEFGEVSLDCQFQIKERAGTKLLLGVTLKIFHARYFNADFLLK
jgi:hypothetical protein